MSASGNDSGQAAAVESSCQPCACSSTATSRYALGPCSYAQGQQLSAVAAAARSEEMSVMAALQTAVLMVQCPDHNAVVALLA